MSPTIHASAPTRIDLAGGTLDIWPLCHLLDRPAITVNLAIDLRAHVWIEEREDRRLEIVSEDRRETVRLRIDEIRHDRLGLVTRMVAWFGPGNGLSIRTRNHAPPHAGLGGSSALAVTLGAALATLRVTHFEGEAFRQFVQNIETGLLRTPTGYQDYYPPLYGGLNVLEATPDGVVSERLPGAPAFLGKHLMLVDTGIEHHSGLTNWEVVRGFLDGDEHVRASLRSIAGCADRMHEAILARDLEGIASALNDEWKLRRKLSPVVSNERIEALVKAAFGAGALGAKICGAGGGGCLVLVVDGDTDAIAQAVEAAGGRPVAFQPDAVGLTVE